MKRLFPRRLTERPNSDVRRVFACSVTSPPAPPAAARGVRSAVRLRRAGPRRGFARYAARSMVATARLAALASPYRDAMRRLDGRSGRDPIGIVLDRVAQLRGGGGNTDSGPVSHPCSDEPGVCDTPARWTSIVARKSAVFFHSNLSVGSAIPVCTSPLLVRVRVRRTEAHFFLARACGAHSCARLRSPLAPEVLGLID